MSLSFYMRDFGSYVGNYAKQITSSKPAWLNFTKDVAKLTGHTKLLDLTTGYNNLERFIFKTNGWTIGGLAFDGIMKTEHTAEVKATTYPVQTGAVMTDHAIVLPKVLDIEIMVSDATPGNSLSGIKTTNRLLNAVVDFGVRRFLTNGNVVAGNNRSAATYAILKSMVEARVPITVVTRLGTYHNMLLVKLNSPDDVKTQFALHALLHLEEVQVGDVAEVTVSARSQTTNQTNGGNKAVTEAPSNQNKSALKAMGDVVRRL